MSYYRQPTPEVLEKYADYRGWSIKLLLASLIFLVLTGYCAFTNAWTTAVIAYYIHLTMFIVSEVFNHKARKLRRDYENGDI